MEGKSETTIRIIVRKSERKLELLDGDRQAGTYDIALGSAPDGAKHSEGDGRTPEGEYHIFTKNDQSKYHLSLAISYPGVEDARRGLEAGIISQREFETIAEAAGAGKRPPQDTPLGGEIYIHGGGSDGDWTTGCIAITDAEMDAIFQVVSVGTSVKILP